MRPPVQWAADVPLDGEPEPGEVYAGRTTRTIGEVPAGSFLVMTILHRGERLVAGSCYIFEGDGDVAFARLLEIRPSGWAVEGIDVAGGELVEIDQEKWRPRALVEVRPGLVN